MHSYIHSFHHPAARCFAMSAGAGPGRRGRHARGPRGFAGRRGPRARRGDVREALLVLLGEEPRNGYQLMQEIERRSDGAWRPSPGSIYPVLAQLEDEGLIRAGERADQRVHELTDAGRAWLAERAEDARAPWDTVKEDVGQGPRQLMRLVREVATAAAQVVHAGDEVQVDQAKEVLSSARRSLYRILAEDPGAEEADGSSREV
jgi:DNA-binding PadR family transcriptional regulator